MQTMRKPEGVPLESDMSKCTVAGRPILCILSRRTTTAGARRRTTPAISTATSAGSVVGRARSRTGGSLQLTPPTVSVVRSIAPAVGPCCFCLEGPLLLSAPHGKEVWREGNWAWVTGISGKRLHRRELYTTELVVRLVDSPPLKSNSSFIVWNARVMKDSREGLDPNYLHSKEMKSSQWHSALHEFRNKFRGDPTGCIHFDIHGKKDRSGPTIDIGLEALRHFAPSLYNKVRAVVNERLSAVLQAVPSVKGGKRFGLTFPGPSERDNGFWQRTADGTLQRPPQSPSTLVSQSAGMGVLGVQIEIPKTLRAIMSEAPRLITEFAKALHNIRNDLCSATLPISVSTQCCSEDELASVAARPVPSQSVPAVVAQLLRDVAMLHLLDTERPI